MIKDYKGYKLFTGCTDGEKIKRIMDDFIERGPVDIERLKKKYPFLYMYIENMVNNNLVCTNTMIMEKFPEVYDALQNKNDDYRKEEIFVKDMNKPIDRFSVTFKEESQLRELFHYLSSIGFVWSSGSSLSDEKIFDSVLKSYDLEELMIVIHRNAKYIQYGNHLVCDSSYNVIPYNKVLVIYNQGV